MLLMIVKENGNWLVRIANTSISRAFQGETTAAQAANLQVFAEAIRDGTDDLYHYIGQVLQLKDGESPQDLVQILFSATDSLELSGELIYPAADYVLIDVLRDVGDALLAAL